jgi:CTP:phosphocholine cytidylyltransferase-like protein
MSAGFLVVQDVLGVHVSRWLSEYVAREEVTVLFDNVLSAHSRESDLFLYEISHNDWVEIDTLQDLNRAEATFR